MRRVGMLAVIALLGLFLATAALAQERDEGRGGPGFGYGMNPCDGHRIGHRMGHWHGGMGGWGWGRHMGWVLSQLPADKQQQLRDFGFSMRRQMIGERAKLEEAKLDLMQAMSKYPVDKQAAQNAYDQMAKVRREMFQLRLTAMMQVQQIIGKDLWQKMHNGSFGPGGGPAGPAGPGMGPGMGPGGGRGR